MDYPSASNRTLQPKIVEADPRFSLITDVRLRYFVSRPRHSGRLRAPTTGSKSGRLACKPVFSWFGHDLINAPACLGGCLAATLDLCSA